METTDKETKTYSGYVRNLRWAAIALSLSNLCLFTRLAWLNSYFAPIPGSTSLLSWVLAVILLGALFWMAAWILTSFGGRFGRVIMYFGFFVVSATAAKNLTRHFFGSVGLKDLVNSYGTAIAYTFTLALAVVIVFLFVKYFGSMVRAISLGILLLTPFSFLLIVQAIVGAVEEAKQGGITVLQKAPGPEHRAERRVVWILFDEFDYELGFTNRPPSLDLPTFDGLESESLYATSASSPSTQTLISLPSLTTGKLVTRTFEDGQHDLLIGFGDDSQFERWKSEALFANLKKRGLRSGIVGWYHPYCRVFRESVTECATDYSLFLNDPSGEHKGGLVSAVADLLNRAGEDILLVEDVLKLFQDDTLKLRSYISTNERLIEQAKRLSVDRRLSLVLIHLPVPHSPYVYDRGEQEFQLDGKANYFDNLALADRVMNDIRKKMKSAGIWDETTVVISSDHAWRGDRSDIEELWAGDEKDSIRSGYGTHIPFIVKPSSVRGLRTERKTFEKSFSTIVTHDLILAVLEGRIATIPEIRNWLEVQTESKVSERSP